MRCWWVNQNQTFEQEFAGGFLWSPKRNANGARNPFYEYLREVAPGDLVLSFQGTRVRAVGIARSYAYECPKPAEFGSAGPNQNRIGWKVEATAHLAGLRRARTARLPPRAVGGAVAGLRNVLVHGYLEIVLEVIASVPCDGLDDFARFARQVEGSLD